MKSYNEFNDYEKIGAFALVVLLVLLSASFIMSEKKFLGYYLEKSDGATCVMTAIDWSNDAKGACFSNPSEALAALQKLKEGK